jgi:hypothetical protein
MILCNYVAAGPFCADAYPEMWLFRGREQAELRRLYRHNHFWASLAYFDQHGCAGFKPVLFTTTHRRSRDQSATQSMLAFHIDFRTPLQPPVSSNLQPRDCPCIALTRSGRAERFRDVAGAVPVEATLLESSAIATRHVFDGAQRWPRVGLTIWSVRAAATAQPTEHHPLLNPASLLFQTSPSGTQ